MRQVREGRRCQGRRGRNRCNVVALERARPATAGEVPPRPWCRQGHHRRGGGAVYNSERDGEVGLCPRH